MCGGRACYVTNVSKFRRDQCNLADTALVESVCVCVYVCNLDENTRHWRRPCVCVDVDVCGTWQRRGRRECRFGPEGRARGRPYPRPRALIAQPPSSLWQTGKSAERGHPPAPIIAASRLLPSPPLPRGLVKPQRIVATACTRSLVLIGSA